MSLDLNSGVDFIDQDIRYMDQLYADNPILFDHWQFWFEANLETILNEHTIPEGKVVQAGTWTGAFYRELQRIFGVDRCVGFDIVDYGINDDSVNYADFRDVQANNTHPMDAAVFYNGLGSWQYNTASKQAGLDWALANLVSGGIYIDVIHKKPEREQALKDVAGLTWHGTYSEKLIVLVKD